MDYSLPEVSFRREGFFTVILQRPQQLEGIDDGKSREKGREKGREKSREKSREKMLEQIRQNPSITMKELSEILQLSPKTIEKQISILKNEGAIIRLGPDRGGEWQVVQKPEQSALFFSRKSRVKRFLENAGTDSEEFIQSHE